MAIKFTTQPVARNATSRNLDSISAAECKLQNKTVEYVENSQYEILPDKGYDGIAKVDVTVNVPTSGGYSYKKNIADVNGLKAIGWDDESIGVYGDNVLGYEWQRSDYLVSQANKDLAEGFTKDTINSNKSNPDFVYCPMFDTSSITDMSFMFGGCSNLKSIPLLGTSSVTNMQSMFNNCSSLQSIPRIDTGLVTGMSNMFTNCRSLRTIPLLDTSSATSMDSMFEGCLNLESIPQLDTSLVTTMISMFDKCSSLQSIPQMNTSKVTNMAYIFRGCSSLRSISQMNTSKVTNMSRMFDQCSSLQSVPQMDTSKVTNMTYMFSGCSSLQSIPQLDTSSATSMNYMFQNCSNLQSVPQLDTSSVTSMNNMLDGCSKLKAIPLLDAGSITSTTTPFGFGSFSNLTDLGGFKNLKVSWSSNFLDRAPKATVESLMNVINNLYDLTANGLSGQTVKFGKTNLEKLTDEQKAVATNKGWTLL